MIILENFINGKFVAAVHYIDSFNPSTGGVCAKVPASGAKEVELAVEAAQNAFHGYVNIVIFFIDQHSPKVVTCVVSKQIKYIIT